MDQRRFDALTRSIADGATRRGVVRGVIGGLAGLLVAARGEGADAKKRKCNQKRCQERSGEHTCCGKKCANTNTDEKNCGRCGKRCRGDQVCRRGKCVGRT